MHCHLAIRSIFQSHSAQAFGRRKTLEYFFLLGCGLGAPALLANEGAQQEILSTNVLRSTTSPEDLAPRRQVEGSWQVGLGAMDSREGQDGADRVNLRLGAKAKVKLMPDLSLMTDAVLAQTSGRVQQRFDDNTQASFVQIYDASLRWQLLDPLQMRLGAIEQNPESQVFINRRAFPGAMIIGDWQRRELGVRLQVEEGIPTSMSLNTERSSQEELPRWHRQSVDVEWTGLAESLKIKSGLTHLVYDNLPSVVAAQSGRQGNFNVAGLGSVANSQFTHGFDVWMLSGSAEIRLWPQGVLFVGGERYQNQDAATELGGAQMLRLGVEFDWKQLEFRPEVHRFFLEPNVLPAFYTNATLGHTNREGERYQMNVDFKSFDFSMSVYFVTARELNANAAQSDLTSFGFQVETHYASF